MRILIPDPFTPQSYDILRSLIHKNRKIIALVPEQPRLSAMFCPTALSCQISQRYRLSLPSEINVLSLFFNTDMVKAIGQKYIEAVLNICRREQVSLIYPSDDNHVLLFSLYKKVFKKYGIEIPLTDFSILCKLMDKLTVSRLANSAGIRVPLTALAKSKNWQLFPAVIKPRLGSGGEGHFLVKNKNEFKQWQKNHSEIERYAIQEFIPGNRISYLRLYIDSFGKLQAASYAENKRPSLRIYQTRALLLRALPIPEKTVVQAHAMLREVGYSGYCHFQMKTDERSQKDKLLEINIRISRGTWSERTSNFNPVELARALTSHNFRKKTELFRGGKDGNLYVWPVQDFLVLVFFGLKWLLMLVKNIARLKYDKKHFFILLLVWQHYYRIYFNRKPKQVDNYTKHICHDFFPALSCWCLFFYNYLIKQRKTICS